MARFRPYVNAVQWTGSNVIEIRQFVATSPTVIKGAAIRGGILFLDPVMSPVTPPPLVIPSSVQVPLNGWIVITFGTLITIDDPAEFAAQYELDT